MLITSFGCALLLVGGSALDAPDAGALAASLRAEWDAAKQSGVVTAITPTTTDATECELAVVGAGWGGAYTAWRLGVDTNTVAAGSICIFEANSRVGGRIYSVRNLPSLQDVTLDVGGYRFIETDRILSDLVWGALKLPTQCYDEGCAKSCPGDYNLGSHTCHVLRDVYGNNAGYALPIETMLGQLMAAGASVRFGQRLARVSATDDGVSLGFESGLNVTASRVVLNLPRNAIAKLEDVDAWLPSPAARAAVLEDVGMLDLTKVYAAYDEAWWANTLGLMEGVFSAGLGDALSTAPLSGRYHDGPLKCVVAGASDASGRPVFSGSKVRFGNCSGALEVFYNMTHPFYAKFASATPQEPLAVYQSGELVDAVHASLMAFHAPFFAALGLETKDVPKPSLVAVSDWTSGDDATPACGRFEGDAHAARLARKPSELPIHIANTDYGPQFCWATGSLIVAEKIVSELGLPPPTWLNESWYAERVANML